MSKELYIYGTGPHALKIYNSALKQGYKVLGFIDDDKDSESPLSEVKVFHNLMLKKAGIIIAIGNNEIRKNIFNKLVLNGWSLETIIHSSAIVSPAVQLGDGIFIGAGVVIESNVVIGDGTIIDIGVIIDHDCKISSFKHIKTGEILMPYTERL